MAEKRSKVSDVSGEEIPEGTGATVTVRFADESRSDRRVDMTQAEAEALGGVEVGRRGRKAGSSASDGSASAAEQAEAVA